MMKDVGKNCCASALESSFLKSAHAGNLDEGTSSFLAAITPFFRAEGVTLWQSYGDFMRASKEYQCIDPVLSMLGRVLTPREFLTVTVNLRKHCKDNSWLIVAKTDSELLSPLTDTICETHILSELKFKNCTIGFLVLHFSKSDIASEFDQDSFQRLSDLLSLVMGQEQLSSTLRDDAEDFRTASEIFRAFLIDKAKATELSSELIRRRLDLASVRVKTVTSPETMQSSNATTFDDSISSDELAESMGKEGFIRIPLSVGDRKLGVLVLEPRDNGRLNSKQIEIAQYLAGQLAESMAAQD